MATYRDQAIVLRMRGLHDHDRYYTVFTADHGKVTLLAKGLRRTRSKMSPHMAALGVVEIMVARGKVFDRLAGANLLEPHRELLESLPRSAITQSFLLAVDSLTRQEYPEPRIFLLLQDFMQVVASLSEDVLSARTIIFDAAVLKLLDILGHGLELDVCVSCRQCFEFDGNALNILRGGIECLNCRSGSSITISGDTIKVLRFIRTTSLKVIPALRLELPVRQQVAFLTDILLTSHLEAKFDPLRYMNSVRI
ncbi:DNA repair protein RecO [Patescibacteria group bacterium]|nr:DNA repair protein RecO [Patescibacteria group bacterium]MBU1029470.1 DNA repair protein RecO [Patescibacteria group bacterium]MBU1916199.1 DNA repair protein RecO [Patescibacteria group bacterium]